MAHKVNYLNSPLVGLQAFEIRSDRHFPRHAHDHFGIGIMLDGAHRSWSGRGQVEAGPNHVITVSPNEIHDGMPIGGAPRRWVMLFVEPSIVLRLAGAEFAKREFPQPVITDVNLVHRIAMTFRELPHSCADEVAESIMELLGLLLDGAAKPPLTSRPSRSMVLILERIHDDPIHTPTLAELATIANLSPYTLVRRFRRELGTTPHAYVLQYRVRRAFRAINEGSTLTEAALSSGFSDQSHMTRAFVRQFGVTPGQFRRPKDRHVA
ncbi:hypothetical protein NS365_05405 [Aureimonas ureilytica]|uniref:HTH araC/xylS-type domain-containing protein n=1 Tax=Aureimonas ureilytica TaxID=401562 RepID=A0A175RW30_9HYPH|nr:AraC family transcriptional regulator [Aureimonas ureilytica]KTR07079.1 hypothetical protein NS365_05405 [Aureimonas ureilytica]